METAPRSDLFARVLGILVFLLGIAIILCVLWLGFGLYQDRTLGIPTAGPKSGPTATDLGAAFIRLIFRIGLLFLGSLSGSLIASKGIHLYFSGLRRDP